MFSDNVSEVLSEAEIVKLVEFLEHPDLRCKTRKTDLRSLLLKEIGEFNAQELEESLGEPGYLANPAGPKDSDIGLILHISSKENEIRFGTFWNKENSTIALLQQQGLDEQFVYGFDWHWRAESTWRGRTGCPIHRWSVPLHQLHDKFSNKVLSLLPLPFVITGSRCARPAIREHLGENCKTVNIYVSPDSDKSFLTFDLEFAQTYLRRIYLHTHHPVAPFRRPSKEKDYMALQADTGSNFILWLNGKQHDIAAFRYEYSLSKAGRHYHLSAEARNSLRK